jgi:anthranilate phosphoribosyltransferase
MMRSITIEELTGFREALLELCIPIDFSNYETIDLCGTGGDGKDTFNISTLASFVVAGSGIKVAKHGNYGVSSISGSSNVMENLGVKFSNQQDYLDKCLEEANIAILHAPLFHPAMKNVGPIRKELGVKTFFNMLGPMVNPSFPKNQLVGVFSLELARMYAYLYQNTTTNFSILYDLEGFDEVSLTGNVKIISNSSEKILKPEDFNTKSVTLYQIRGGETVEEAANIFMTILSGNGTQMQNEVVCANAALAISMMKKTSIEESLAIAKESLMSGKALDKLKTLQNLSRS